MPDSELAGTVVHADGSYMHRHMGVYACGIASDQGGGKEWGQQGLDSGLTGVGMAQLGLRVKVGSSVCVSDGDSYCQR